MTRRLPFPELLHRGVGEGATPNPGLFHLILDPYLIILSVKQGSIKHHFSSLWYESNWDRTPVSRTIGEHSTYQESYPNIYIYIPNSTSPHYLNFLSQLMPIRLSSGSSHLRPGAFHMFYKYTTDIIYITESGRKKNKQTRICVRPKRKKRDVLSLFCASVAIASVYPKKILLNYQERWLICSLWLTWLLGPQVPTPRFSSRVSLTVARPWLSPTPKFLLENLAFLRLLRSRRKSHALCVGLAPKQTKESSDWCSPRPTPTERMPTIVPHLLKQIKPWKIFADVGSITVFSRLTRCALFYSVFDLEVTQMNVQQRLKAPKITKKAFVWGRLRRRCSKKFCPGCKNFDDQLGSYKTKTFDSQAVLLSIEANPVSSIQRVSGELGISEPNAVHHFSISKNAFGTAELYLTFCKLFDSPSKIDMKLAKKLTNRQISKNYAYIYIYILWRMLEFDYIAVDNLWEIAS